MGGLGIGPAFFSVAAPQVIVPVAAQAKLTADVEALEAERAALQAQLDAVRGRRGGGGWPWWAKVGGGILALTVAAKIARRWGS